MESNKNTPSLDEGFEEVDMTLDKGFEDETLPTGDAKKKYIRISIEIGWFHFGINGRSVGIRSPFYFKNKTR